MQTYRRRTRVAAPLEDVWEFHSTIDGLEALTPGFMNLRIEAVRGPDGRVNPNVLEEGTDVRMSIRPFGIGPRQRWTSRIVERETGPGRAHFVDEMRDGPFPTWHHTHRFFGDSAETNSDDGRSRRGDVDETVIEDEVVYELPFGPVGEALGPLGVVGFEPMFRARHRKTRELLE